ncbi:O-antigen ligase family protein [Candidatus Uhrbacteria bacterium]|nr:O-antigen ligase family protein [Candidatus Uhrbacteria bacterium]
MELIREIAWRISIILLPWQTRFFIEGPLVNGFPWEHGRLSFYASWIPMLITVFFVCLQRVLPRRHPDARFGEAQQSGSPSVRHPLCAGFIMVVIVSLFTTNHRATLQWWAQVVILFAFFWSLYQLKIDRNTFIKWFLISLIPHACLGIWQYVAQFVHGTKWLGMATQDPITKGVSVMEIAGRRILRAYGGFPHPNIFGGWLAVALTLSVRRRGQGEVVLSWLSIFLFSTALFFTYSRSAWIATLVGLMLIFIIERKQWRRLIPAGFIFCIMFGGLFFWQKDVVLSRVQIEQHLETKSISERQIGLRDGLALFQQHPLVGVGPGATMLAIHPHNIFLLALVEFGSIGMLGLILLLYTFFCRLDRSHLATCYVLLATLFPIVLLDHYLWSYWSGLCLFAFVGYILYICPTTQASNRE